MMDNEKDVNLNLPGEKGEEEKENQQIEENKEQDQEEKDEKQYTQEDVNKIVQNRLARAMKEKERAVKEAEKLAKMNAQQKQEYELEKLRKENEELKAAQNRYELGKEATQMLAESGITANDDILGFVVRDDAESTSEAVTAFADLVSRLAEDLMMEKLKGKSPKVQVTNNKPLTKKEIMSVKDTAKRHELIKQNIHLFK